MEQEQPSEEIRRQLMTLTRHAKFGEDTKEFICADELKEVLTEQDIRDCISTIPFLENSQDDGRDIRRYASLIWESSLTIFAILLADANHKYILRFLFRRDTDQRLAFTKEDLYYLPELARDRFVERQWTFHPVMLTPDGIHRDINPKAILPFLSHTTAGAGGFGTVWKVKVYPRCQTLVTQTPGELNEGHQGVGERRILSLLNSLKHPHIIEFLGSYTQNEVCNLLFPAASFDLREFLSKKSQLPFERHAIYANVYGLADALQHIHDFNFEGDGVEFSRIGYHHDLRPANILVCDGKFVIADFGLSKLKPDDQSSRTTLRGGQDDYLGPEHFNYEEWAKRMVGRPLDVWAFGCILAEIATFIEDEDVGDFRDKRKATHQGQPSVTDYAFHLDGKVRPAVSQWLDQLVLGPDDPQVAQLVTIVRDVLNTNPHKRPKISEITPKLQLLAIDSMFVVVDDLLQGAYLGGNNISMSNQQVCILLEHKRVLAFRAAFVGLRLAIRLECVDAVFKKLQNLVMHLQGLKAFLRADTLPETIVGLPTALLAKIDALYNTLPLDVVKDFEELWSQAVCNIEDVDILRAIRFSSKPKRYRSVGISAAMKHMSKLIIKSIQLGERSRYLDSAVVEVDDTPSNVRSADNIQDNSKIMGYYSDCNTDERFRIMVEWKEYEARWKDGGPELFSVMNDLVNLLDPGITPRQGVMAERILNCLGYFHERHLHRFGFVYSLKSESEQSQLFSLNKALRILAASGALGPDLGDIFQLARDLAACLLAVHEVGWFHKNFSSHHVLIFAPNEETISQRVVSAVLSGFNDSRPEASSFTLGPKQDSEHYKHPKYVTGTPFRNVFDYYGLGIVLLELGSWEPISELRHRHKDIVGSEKFRLKLLKSYVPQLGERMGARYRNAVQACLDVEGMMNSLGQDPEDAGAAREFFKSRVVQSLAGCFA
ncbi:kinase-like domain-containing protein [Hypomontagnella monticulosa]|nr:kinase-like domain-containing protein [Hypomontagnella monticulosa]